MNLYNFNNFLLLGLKVEKKKWKTIIQSIYLTTRGKSSKKTGKLLIFKSL